MPTVNGVSLENFVTDEVVQAVLNVENNICSYNIGEYKQTLPG
jgi:hypothetical protein